MIKVLIIDTDDSPNSQKESYSSLGRHFAFQLPIILQELN